MGGGGGMEKKPKKIHARENAKKKKFVQRRRERKKIHAEGRSNCNFYLIYKICQVPIKKSSYSKYSWGPTPGPPILLIIKTSNRVR